MTFGATFLYYVAIWRERWTRARWPLTLALVSAFVSLVLAAPQPVVTWSDLAWRNPLLMVALLASALILGWSLVTMLLGHWYLVVPGLSFRHLVVFCQVLLAAVVLRMLTVAASLLSASQVDPLVDPHPLRMLVGSQGQGMFFWIRLLWGLAIPLTLGIMALHCARRRSNQSATGILYVLLVGTIVGEITAYYLMVTTGVPC
jgi:hypothetical protein